MEEYKCQPKVIRETDPRFPWPLPLIIKENAALRDPDLISDCPDITYRKGQ